MSNTSNLVLPYLAVGQAQKHVTVNETLRRLDAVVQLSVVSASTPTQPASPGDWEVYIVPSGKSGAQWGGYASWSLGYYRDGAWEQVSPREGWLAYVKDTDQLLAYTGSAWEMFAPGKLLTLSATDKLVGRSSAGAGVAEEVACTAAGRALLDDADARAQCATLGTWRVLAASAVASAHTGDTLEAALATVSLPGGAMGANGVLRITAMWSYTNSANAKTPRMRLGGTSGTIVFGPSVTTTGSLLVQRLIQNRNAQNSQVMLGSANSNSYAASTGAPLTTSVDLSTTQDLVFSGQLANSGETITLESHLVEVLQR
jgi:Protein of unknown function (DUF2793)